jgi:Ser/Thr protein kinase RdoA (MazF antagonist)
VNDEALLAVLAAWDLGGGCRLRASPGGKSRLTRFLDTPTGSYVVTAYEPGTSPERVRYEQALLTALGAAGVPFAVPVPVPARSGEAIVPTVDSDGERLVALFTVVPGDGLDRRSIGQTRAFGEAFGWLHQAFGEIDPGPAPAPDRVYGAMEQVLAGNRGLVESLAGSPLDGAGRQRIAAMLEHLMDEGPPTMAGLPRQLRHGDCHRGNALVAGDRISGILDFEVAGPGVRAMDLAYGAYDLWAWCDPPGAAWEHIAAFAGGYRSAVRPTEREVAAVPMLARLYFAASIPYVVARWRAGAASEERLRGRVEQVVRLDDFFERDGERLVGMLASGG